MNKLITIIIVMSGLAAAKADDVPRILRDANQLNSDRRLRVEAEIALQATIVDAKQDLLDDGYAAPLEVDVACLQLKELTCLQAAIGENQRLLDELVAASQNGLRGTRHRSRNRATAQSLPNSVSDISVRIASKQTQQRGRSISLLAEAEYLSELLKRLRQAKDESAGAKQEVALTEMKLRVVRGRTTMEKSQRRLAATLEQLHLAENYLDAPILLHGATIESAEQLAAVLQTAWLVYRTKAQRDSLAAQLEMELKYGHRLAELDKDHYAHPGEALTYELRVAATREELMSLERRVDDLQSQLDAYIAGRRQPTSLSNVRLLDSVAASLLNDMDLSMAMPRQHVAELASLAANDPTFGNELRRVELELAVFAAADEVLRQQAARVATADLPDEDAIQVMLRDRHAELAAMSKLATSRMNLIQWKLANLAPLRRLGYATWQEVALAERDLAIAQALRQAIVEAREIAMLKLERMRIVLAENDNSIHTAMTNTDRLRKDS